MVWLTDKKIFYHFLDLGFERVKIPIRVKFECEVKEGVIVPDSISRSILYNLQALQMRYPQLDRARLQQSIEQKVDSEIRRYLEACGYPEAESE